MIQNLFQGGDIDDSLIKLLETSLLIWSIVKWLLILVFLGLLGCGVGLIYLEKQGTNLSQFLGTLKQKQLSTQDLMDDEKK